MSFRKILFYTKNKASDAFSRDSNYEFDCMLRIKGQVLKSYQLQLFKHYYINILNFFHDFNLPILPNNVSEVKTSLSRHHFNINLW